MRNIYRKDILFIAIALLALPGITYAHTINFSLEEAPLQNVVWYYLKLGVVHIIPYGLDHILFVAGLCLLNTKLKTMLWQATAFTVAHTITLALSMKSVIALPADIVEPIIALSIVFIAVENLLADQLKAWRIALVFIFGLIHGMGFASALNEIGLPRDNFFTSIVSFNIGVEIGQVAVIALVYFLLTRPFGQKPWYKKRIMYPLSAVIALVATWWTVERMFFS